MAQFGEAAAPLQRAYGCRKDAEGALRAYWRDLARAGVLEVRLCDRLTTLTTVALPAPDDELVL